MQLEVPVWETGYYSLHSLLLLEAFVGDVRGFRTVNAKSPSFKLAYFHLST